MTSDHGESLNTAILPNIIVPNFYSTHDYALCVILFYSVMKPHLYVIHARTKYTMIGILNYDVTACTRCATYHLHVTSRHRILDTLVLEVTVSTSYEIFNPGPYDTYVHICIHGFGISIFSRFR